MDADAVGEADVDARRRVVEMPVASGDQAHRQIPHLSVGGPPARLVLGARVPIILTSRSDSLKVRIASAALAKLVAAKRAAQGLPAQ